MRFSAFLSSLALSSLVPAALGAPLGSSSESSLVRRASDKVGYLFAHFKEDDEAIFFDISNGNDALSYSPLNGGNAVFRSDVGTKGLRDPFLIGSPDGQKHWIIATDLNHNADPNTNFIEESRVGSTAIVVYEGNADLTEWSSAQLVNVMPPTAGMVWAPEAIYDETEGNYLMYWASHTYASNDTNHTGEGTTNEILAARTSDFKSFSDPFVYISYGYPLIDTTMRRVDDSTFVRFTKREGVFHVFGETAPSIMGPWTRMGDENTYIDSSTEQEGPLFFQDNLDSSKWYVWVDEYLLNPDGYYPWVPNTDIKTAGWTKLSGDQTSKFPYGGKHGVVQPVTQTQYDALKARYSS